MATISRRLDDLEREIADAVANGDAKRAVAGWRAVLECFREMSAKRVDPEPAAAEPEYLRLWEAARLAMANLGGQGEPTLRTLADYDHRRYGPMLGVSDEGSATAAIRHGALASPKCAALVERSPPTVGVAHDAERLGAVGEVVVGPDEFAAIRLACRDRLLTTTNVGSRVNVRHFLVPPEVRIKSGRTEAVTATAIERLKELFAPFVRTPNSRARSITILIRFDRKIPMRQRAEVLRRLQAAVSSGDFCSPQRHRIGLLVELSSNQANRVVQAQSGIDLAVRCRVGEVALDGPVLRSAREAISLPGLLNHFDPEELAKVLRYAADCRVRIGPSLRVDPQTTARHVWTGLSVARNMGFELGKYGLFPLTFEEQKEVIVRIQHWFGQWCPAPVYYVDYPLVTASDVYYGSRLAAGIRRWLDMVGKLGVRVVLIDTVKKSEGRRLLQDSPDDKRGFLPASAVADLTAFADSKGVKVLWAGGITLPQAFEMGRLGVFGIYVTSAAATLEPVGRRSRRDPFLAASREPQPEAVARVKLLMEAGFHVGRLQANGVQESSEALAGKVNRLLGASDETQARQHEADLHSLLVRLWQEIL